MRLSAQELRAAWRQLRHGAGRLRYGEGLRLVSGRADLRRRRDEPVRNGHVYGQDLLAARRIVRTDLGRMQQGDRLRHVHGARHLRWLGQDQQLRVHVQDLFSAQRNVRTGEQRLHHD